MWCTLGQPQAEGEGQGRCISERKLSVGKCFGNVCWFHDWFSSRRKCHYLWPLSSVPSCQAQRCLGIPTSCYKLDVQVIRVHARYSHEEKNVQDASRIASCASMTDWPDVADVCVSR